MDASLRQIRTFLAVARLRHVTRAARQLHLTQPAITHQLRQLEAALGIALVTKEGRGIGLTAAGEALADRIKEPLERLEAVLAEVASGPPRGAVRIATLQSYNEALAIPAAASLAQTHPDIRIVTREMSGDAIELALLEGRADLGLTFQIRRMTALRSEPLAKERLFAVFRPDAFPALPKRPALRHLAPEPLALLPRDYALRALIDDLAAAERVRLRVAFESTNLAGLILYAAGGRGIAIVRELAIALAERKGMSARPIQGTTPRTALLVHAPGGASGAVEVFAQALRDTARASVNSPGGRGRP